MRTAVIAGGGIGGLAAAIALSRAGWQVEVLEQAPEVSEVGAGLSLWPNALRALDHIGLGDRIRSLGLIDATGGIRDEHGRWLIRTDTSELDRRFGSAVALHRADLHTALLESLPDDVLHTGIEITGVRLENDGVVVTHSAGESKADLLVGADGLRSVVRGQFWPDSDPVYFGATAWRTVLDRPGERLDLAGEFWGRGEEFGVVQLPKDQVYFFAGALAEPGVTSPDGELAEMRRRFGDWSDPIPQLLSEASPDTILRHDLYYLPKLRSYVHGPIVLLGDAAHAMTPNMGQGACQAIEDAVTLGALAATGNDIPAVLAGYDSLRRPRTQSISRLSRTAGRVGLAKSPLAVAARNRLMSLVPPSAMFRSFKTMYDWSPPSSLQK